MRFTWALLAFSAVTSAFASPFTGLVPRQDCSDDLVTELVACVMDVDNCPQDLENSICGCTEQISDQVGEIVLLMFFAKVGMKC